MPDTVQTAIYKLGGDSSSLVQAQDAATASAQKMVAANEQVEVQQERVDVATRTTVDGFTKLEARYDSVMRLELQRANALDQATRFYDEGTVGADRYVSSLVRINDHYNRQVDAAQKVTVANENVRRSGLSTGQAIQQAGFQFGDFFVQIASGQGVMRPLIQQGTQLVSMFGAWGAVVGAVGAGLGAIITSTGLFGDSAESATEKQNKLNKALETSNELLATNAQRTADAAATGLKRTEATNQLAENLVDVRKEASRRRDAGLTSQNVDPGSGFAIGNGAENPVDIGARDAQIAELSRQIDGLTASRRTIEQLDEALHDLDETVLPMGDAVKKLATGTDLLDESLKQGAITLQQYDDRLGTLVGHYAEAINAADPLLKSQRDYYAGLVAQIDGQEKAEQSIFDMAAAQRAENDNQKLSNIDREKSIALLKAQTEAAKVNGTVSAEQARQIAASINEKYAPIFRQQNGQAVGQQDEQTQRDTSEAQEVLNRQQMAIAASQNATADLKEQADAAALSTTRWNALTGAYEVNDRELRIVVESQRLFNEQQGISLDKAHELAVANIDAADKVTRANQTAERSVRGMNDTLSEVSQFAETAFSHVGSAITTAFVQGKGAAVDFGTVVQGVLSEIIQEFIKLAAINPLKNALFGTNSPTLSGVGGFLGNLFGSGGGDAAATAGMSGAVQPLFFASGTDSAPGGPAVVGENGMELVNLPRGAQVVPNDITRRMLAGNDNRSGGGTVIVQNIDQRSSGAPVQTQTSRDNNGNTVIRNFIRDETNKNVANGSMDKTMQSSYGTRRLATNRG